jgi:hypothetical protein
MATVTGTPATTEASLVQALRQRPDDRELAAVLEDFWQEQGRPSPVRLHHLPNWLRLSWLRKVKVAPRHYSRLVSGWAVGVEIDEYLSERMPHHGVALDHWGSSTIGGVLCLVSEPYQDIETCRALFAPCAALLGCACAASTVAIWQRSCRRAILFPPMELKLN